jgi:glutamyl-tRNA synthetase/glutamyl-Q tRNA(Asp) synthetase
VVRGRDIAPSTATQVMLQRMLGAPTPRYRHHMLLLEHAKGEKLAKLHGSIPFGELRARYSGEELCGVLAQAAGLVDEARPCTPRSLVASFDWSRIRSADRVATFDGERGLVVE